MGAMIGREINAEATQNNANEVFNYASKPGPWFTCDAKATMEPRMAEAGVSGTDTPATTLPEQLINAATAKGDKNALLVERPCPPLENDRAPPALPEAEWTKWTFKAYLEEVQLAAKGMVSYGFQPFDSVNIWGFNSPEWVMAAMSATFAGGKAAGLYPTDTPDIAAYKVVHSGGSVIVVEEKSKVEKLRKALDERGDAKRIKVVVAYGYEPTAGETVSIKGCGDVPVISWKSLLEKGGNGGSLTSIDVKPGHCAALIYTSGTTGDPKAVMISHDNIIFEANSVITTLQKSVGTLATAEEERLLSYLPQSHVAGMMVDIVTPIIGSSMHPGWVALYFARNYDLKVGTIKDRLCVARPTLFLGVPLVWEKIADKLRALGAETTGAKKAIATWAKGLALEHAKNCQLGGSGRYPVGYAAASTVVLNNIKAALGLDYCKYGFTGAAPIRVDTLEYFGSLGLWINEVYGMSECTGASTISVDETHAWGSCGFELPGCEVKAFKVDDTDFNKKTEVERAPDLETIDEKYQGELCFRGRNIMMGYLANPDLGAAHVEELKKKTAETIDNDGWLHSGDKGMITKAGMVKITGRYKELIIGEGGENIAPVPIEDHVKKTCDGINEVMMIGDKRKYNVALVTLKAKGANGETPGTDELDAGAKRVNANITTISAAMDDEVWIKTVTDAITSANNNAKICINNSFKIQKFCILPTNFSEEKNELTPTKKLKRKVVETAYADLIEKMYASKETYVRFS